MILAAGRGTRLRPLTDEIPKAMVPFADKPLLEYVVRLLARHGFDDLVINLHYLPQVITDYFGDGRAWGVSITYSLEDELLGTAGAVRQVADCFDGPFLVYYGDNLTNFDLGDLWQTHQREGEIASIGLLWMDDPTTRGIIGLDAHHRIDPLRRKTAARPSIRQLLGQRRNLRPTTRNPRPHPAQHPLRLQRSLRRLTRRRPPPARASPAWSAPFDRYAGALPPRLSVRGLGRFCPSLKRG